MLYHYRSERKFLLHSFVVMPNHFHVILTPAVGVTLERSMQFIKGGYSFRAIKELGIHRSIWQPGYFDYRIRDEKDFEKRQEYIHQNPVRAHLVERAQDFPFSSANPAFEIDDVPQRLKPDGVGQRVKRGA